VIQNTFVIIMEEGYMAAKYDSKYGWVAEQAYSNNSNQGIMQQEAHQATAPQVFESREKKDVWVLSAGIKEQSKKYKCNALNLSLLCRGPLLDQAPGDHFPGGGRVDF